VTSIGEGGALALDVDVGPVGAQRRARVGDGRQRGALDGGLALREGGAQRALEVHVTPLVAGRVRVREVPGQGGLAGARALERSLERDLSGVEQVHDWVPCPSLGGVPPSSLRPVRRTW
jgi:hypothetical protein